MVHVRRGGAQAHLLVRTTADDPVPPGWESHPVGLEELALAYLREPENRCSARSDPPPGHPEGLGGGEMTAINYDASTAPLQNKKKTQACGRCHGGEWPGSPGASTVSH